MSARGGARPGAGRPRKTEQQLAQTIGSLVEMAIGQSSVQLELDSKQQVKPTVSAYHPDVNKAGKLCEAEFDRLMAKYHPRAAAAATPSIDAFSDQDLALLGLQRISS